MEVKIFCLPLQSQMKGKHNRGVAQLASASGLGPEGPVFESQYPDILPKELTDFQWVLFLFLCIQQLNHLRFQLRFHLRIHLSFLHENALLVDKQENQLRFLHENACLVDKRVNPLWFLHENACFVDKRVNPLRFLHENTFANCIGETGKYPSVGFCWGGCFFLLHLPPFLLYLR